MFCCEETRTIVLNSDVFFKYFIFSSLDARFEAVNKGKNKAGTILVVLYAGMFAIILVDVLFGFIFQLVPVISFLFGNRGSANE